MKSKISTGMMIPYTVRDTQDKGLGVFTNIPVSRETEVWRHNAGQYTVYDEELLRKSLDNLSRSEAVYELTHMFGLAEFPGYLIRVLDDGVLINHADKPNIAMNTAAANYVAPEVTSLQDVTEALLDSRFSLIAIRDIATNEELTLDYNTDVIDPNYYDDFCEHYGVTWDWL